MSPARHPIELEIDVSHPNSQVSLTLLSDAQLRFELKEGDRLCKNVANATVSFQQNLPLWKGVLYEKEPIRCRTDRGSARKAEAGMPVADLIRRIGVVEQTFYRWKMKELATTRMRYGYRNDAFV